MQVHPKMYNLRQLSLVYNGQDEFVHLFCKFSLSSFFLHFHNVHVINLGLILLRSGVAWDEELQRLCNILICILCLKQLVNNDSSIAMLKFSPKVYFPIQRCFLHI